MRKIFWLGLIGLLAFEVANVYFIMPMPGSQEMNSISLAYFLYSWRWVFRIVFSLMIILGVLKGRWKRKYLLLIPVLLVAAVVYMANFVMAADHMFYQPNTLLLTSSQANAVEPERLVIGVEHNGQAKAYPIRFLGYHHQVRDVVGGKPVMITYCTVCRTGRVFEPVVNGKPEIFRLVGMDHFNAMLEDASTNSWWRQVNGEAIAGKLKGQQLPEVMSTQTSLAQWIQLHPNTLIMQEDPAFIDSYDSSFNYESGKSRKDLTGTDTASWNNKSWVVGVKSGMNSKAFDWNKLKQTRIIQDTIAQTPVLLVLTEDQRTFFAFERSSSSEQFTLNRDTILLGNRHFKINGTGIDTVAQLKRLPAYQEFWHSWRTFHPTTTRY